jgi:hypothetical protein
MANDGPDAALREQVDVTVPQIADAPAFFEKEWSRLDGEVKSPILAILRAWYTTSPAIPIPSNGLDARRARRCRPHRRAQGQTGRPAGACASV